MVRMIYRGSNPVALLRSMCYFVIQIPSAVYVAALKCGAFMWTDSLLEQLQRE